MMSMNKSKHTEYITRVVPPLPFFTGFGRLKAKDVGNGRRRCYIFHPNYIEKLRAATEVEKPGHASLIPVDKISTITSEFLYFFVQLCTRDAQCFCGAAFITVAVTQSFGNGFPCCPCLCLME